MKISLVPFVRLGNIHIPDEIDITVPNYFYEVKTKLEGFRPTPPEAAYTPRKLVFLNDMIVCPLHLVMSSALTKVMEQIRVPMQPERSHMLIASRDIPRHRDTRLWALNCVINSGDGESVVYDPFNKIEHRMKFEKGDVYIQNVSLPHWAVGINSMRFIMTYSIYHDCYEKMQLAYPGSPNFAASTHHKKLRVA